VQHLHTPPSTINDASQIGAVAPRRRRRPLHHRTDNHRSTH